MKISNGMQNEEAKDRNESEQDANQRVYELGYLLTPAISEEDLPAAFGNLKDTVISSGGVPISEEMPKMIQLAYTMERMISNVRHKFDTAYFGWIKFTMDSDKMAELKKKLDLDPTLVRFLIIKTVKENTLASKRYIRPEAHKRPKIQKEGESGTPAPINKEEIDKEIDAMVAA